MLDLKAQLQLADARVVEIQKSIDLQVQVLRKLADRGMDKTLGQRMLDVRIHELEQMTAQARRIASRVATQSELSKIAKSSAERTAKPPAKLEKQVELENSLA